jgi:hypothetical protein
VERQGSLGGMYDNKHVSDNPDCQTGMIFEQPTKFYIFDLSSITYTKCHTLLASSINLKSLPFPSSLSTQIFPSCFSANSLQSNKPSPEPFSFAVPIVLIFEDILKSALIFSSLIPTPLSEMVISTQS